LGVKVGLQGGLMKEEIHLRESSCSHTLGKRVSGGPLAPLGTEIGLDKGRKSARSYPSIEVVPADSELHKRTARQGVGYVRTQGVRRSVTPHSPQSYGSVTEECCQVCSRGTGREEQKRKRGGVRGLYIFDPSFDLGRDEPSSDVQFATGRAAQTGC
jgi:hypothetical protein